MAQYKVIAGNVYSGLTRANYSGGDVVDEACFTPEDLEYKLNGGFIEAVPESKKKKADTDSE